MKDKTWLRQFVINAIPFATTVVVVIFFQITTGGKLLSTNNIRVLTNQIFSVLLISLAAIFVYAHKNLDISIGGMVGCAMLFGTLAVNATSSILVGFIVILIFCSAIGFTNGVLQKFFKHLPFLPSLCMMFILRAIVTYAGNIQTFKISNEYAVYDNTTLKIVVLIALAFISYYLFDYTKIGKFNKAMGGNQVTAEQSGVNIAKYKILAFLLVGIYSAVASFFLMVRTRSVVAESGNGLEFDVMIALIYGGMPLSGGMKTKFLAAVFGAIIVTVLKNGLIMWGLSTGMVALVKAIIFMLLISVNYTRTKGPLPR
ncbi:MAG: ABC transporter permease [Tannerellaceae bacterium]|jgi:ribose transport system permease protein|nr:ABC transporter permease [Tannerellaceae bacterium]